MPIQWYTFRHKSLVLIKTLVLTLWIPMGRQSRCKATGSLQKNLTQLKGKFPAFTFQSDGLWPRETGSSDDLTEGDYPKWWSLIKGECLSWWSLTKGECLKWWSLTKGDCPKWWSLAEGDCLFRTDKEKWQIMCAQSKCLPSVLCSLLSDWFPDVLIKLPFKFILDFMFWMSSFNLLMTSHLSISFTAHSLQGLLTAIKNMRKL